MHKVLRLKLDIRLRIVVLLWKWCDVRSKVNAGELMPTCQETVRAVNMMVHDILDGGDHQEEMAKPRCPKWSPPDREVLKINVDGAFKAESKSGAWGFIIRDHEGTPVLAGAGNSGPTHDALIAQTLAGKQVPEAATYFEISHIIIETDSCHLREAITSTSRDLAVGGGHFSGIRALLHENFNYFSVCNIPRSCNSSAHELASMGMSWDLGQGHVWADPLPEFVIAMAAREFAEHQSFNTRP